jgi:type I restriction enzyme, R subunit
MRSCYCSIMAPRIKSTTEAFSRVKVDALLRDVGWNLEDGRSVRFEDRLSDGSKADYVLSDRYGRALAVIEAKRASIDARQAEGQALAYAKLLDVPFIFLSNGTEVWFWDFRREAHPHAIKTFFAQADLERRIATLATRVDPLTVPIDAKIAGRHYQKECIDTLCQEINQGRRKLLVEMATGTGKTRMAAALIKRLFQASAITRVLFLVDRITLAKQTEDVFAEHLKDYPAYVLTAGRFHDEKRITITTLQGMANGYRDYSSGYFDLVITDECHRSIYGKWSGVLNHFDGIKVGLTATPCVIRPDLLDQLPDAEDGAFIRDTLRFFEVDQPTFRYTLRDAITAGYLVPYQIYRALTVKTAAEGGFQVRRDELDWSDLDEATRIELEDLFKAGDTITADPSALERRFTIPERNRAIVREFRQVLEKGYTGQDGVRRAPMDGKTIVFAVTKRHAMTLAQMLDAEFAAKKPTPEVRYADFVVSGAGEEESADAQAKIKRFKKEDFPRIMVSVNMLDTGFDHPEVVNLVMARFTRSAVLYQQMRGRGARRADHIHKAAFTIFDFVGNVDFHGDSEETPQGGLVIAAMPAKEPPKPRALLVLDIDDHIDPGSRGWITLDDEGRPVQPPEVERRAHDLGMRFEGWLLEQGGIEPDQERLLRMVGEQIKANADRIESFDLHRFLDPPFTYRGGLQRAEGLFGGRPSLEALLDSLNRSVFSAEQPPAS